MTTDTYERPDIQQNDDGDIHIRASAVGGCYRRLWYQYWGNTPTDTRSRSSQNRLEAGTLLEQVVIEDLESSGKWSIQPWKEVPKTADVLEYPLIDNLIATGTPDALGAFPLGTEIEEWHPLEIKTRSPIVWTETKYQGNIIRNPDAVAQLAIYRAALIDNGFILPDADSAISSMNIVTGEVNTEIFSSRVLESVMDSLFETMETFLFRTLPDDEPPPRPYEEGSWQCRGCHFRSLCYGRPISSQKQRREVPFITDEDLAEQFAIWEDATLNAKQHERDNDLHQHTRQMFGDYLERLGETKMKIKGRAGNYNISVRTNTTPEIDRDKLRYYLTPEQFDECIGEKKTSFVDIRKGR